MRHAEAFKNLPHDPATDPAKLEDLTEKGRKQAVDAAPKLKDVSAPFYCSPAGRARATAALVAETRGAAPPVSDPGFGPLVDGKDVDGKPFPIAKRMSAWKRGEDPKPADGESLADVKARAAAAANALAKAHPGGAAVVVAHGEVAACLVAHATRRDEKAVFLSGGPPHCGVLVFEIAPDGTWTFVGPLT